MIVAVIIEVMRAVWVAIILAACGSSPPSPSPVPAAKLAPPPDAAVDAPVDASVAASRGEVAEALARMGSFRDEMCDCKDKVCAERVTDELTRWGQEIAARSSKDQPRITEQEVRQMAEITETMTKCMTTAMFQSAPRDQRTDDASSPGTSGGTTPQNVAPGALDANRIAGDKHILPDPDTKVAMATVGESKLVAIAKLCVTSTGKISSVTMLKSSGYDSYDQVLRRGIREWRYRPFTVNGKATAVCTTVTFIYQQDLPAPGSSKPAKP